MTWYDELLADAKARLSSTAQDLEDALVEQFSSFQATGEILGVDFTLGRQEGPTWPAVAVVLFVALLVALLVAALRR